MSYRNKRNIASEFDVYVTVYRNKFRIIKRTRYIKFSILFWNETLHGSDSCSVHHQEYFTVHTAMVYVIPVCEQLASRMRILPASCQKNGMTYTIAVCTVKYSWWWTEELSETCKVSFQNKIKKLMHLVGFITRNIASEVRFLFMVSGLERDVPCFFDLRT
jgi:hypothetical protein